MDDHLEISTDSILYQKRIFLYLKKKIKNKLLTRPFK